MAGARVRIISGAGLAAGLLVASYPVLFRTRCLTWGATPDEVARNIPGDELLPDADEVSTRAITISAPPGCVWPWLVQMGSGRGGAYTYDWIENLFGLRMHSANVILPQFQDVRLGDEFPPGPGRQAMRVAAFEPERVFAVQVGNDRNWVWIFALYPENGITRLVSRNRIRMPGGSAAARAAWALLMEPGSLVMERKMLLGIKERAERLARDRQEPASPGPAAQDAAQPAVSHRTVTSPGRSRHHDYATRHLERGLRTYCDPRARHLS